MRVLHILDHSLPLHSGYVFRTMGILKAQRELGWDTVHLTTPKHELASLPVEDIDADRQFGPQQGLGGIETAGAAADDGHAQRVVRRTWRAHFIFYLF